MFYFRPLFRSYNKDDEFLTQNTQLPNMLPEIQEQVDLSKTPMEVQDIGNFTCK